MPPDDLMDDADGTVESAALSLIQKPAAPAAQPKPPVAARQPVVQPPLEPEEDTPINDPNDAPPVEEPVDEAPPEEAEPELDEIELDLVIDGEGKKVKIGELKKRYSLDGAIEKRLQETTELRSTLEQQAQQAHGFLEQQKQKLRQMDEFLAQQQPEGIDWEKLRVTDPGRYLLERDKARDLQDKRQKLLVEHEKLARQQQEIQINARNRYIANEEAQLRKKIPDLNDPAKAGEFNSRMMKAAQTYYGYSPEEYNSVLDHRAMLVLRDAAAWQEHVAKQKNLRTTKEVLPKQLLKPGNGTGRQVSTASRVAAAATKKARETGSPDDVAKTLLVRRPSR